MSLPRAAAAAAAAAAFGLAALGTSASAQTAQTSQIERGRYLVRAGDCESCHTVKQGQAFAGGMPIPTPFGVIYSPNITPDPDTGIGKWSKDDFWNAMHRGIDDEGKHLYPGVSLSVVHQVEPRRRRRDQGLSRERAGDASIRTWRPNCRGRSAGAP